MTDSGHPEPEPTIRSPGGPPQSRRRRRGPLISGMSAPVVMDDFATGDPAFDLVYRTVATDVVLFAERRRTVKRRSTFAAIGTAGASGLTTLVLGLRILGFEAWFVAAAFILSATATLVAVWDGHFRHRALWIQRTLILNRMQRLQEQMKLAALVDAESARHRAREFAREREAILDFDLMTWLAIRSEERAGASAVDLPQPAGPDD